MPKPIKTKLELDFLELEKKYQHDPLALEVLCKAAEVSCRYVDFLVKAIQSGTQEPQKTFKFALNVQAHINKHKNEAAAIRHLRAEIENLKVALNH
jgi:hypothetical protein